jgi:hypothetical protein
LPGEYRVSASNHSDLAGCSELGGLRVAQRPCRPNGDTSRPSADERSNAAATADTAATADECANAATGSNTATCADERSNATACANATAGADECANAATSSNTAAGSNAGAARPHDSAGFDW